MMMQKQNLFVREERFSIFLSYFDEKDWKSSDCYIIV